MPPPPPERCLKCREFVGHGRLYCAAHVAFVLREGAGEGNVTPSPISHGIARGPVSRATNDAYQAYRDHATIHHCYRIGCPECVSTHNAINPCPRCGAGDRAFTEDGETVTCCECGHTWPIA